MLRLQDRETEAAIARAHSRKETSTSDSSPHSGVRLPGSPLKLAGTPYGLSQDQRTGISHIGNATARGAFSPRSHSVLG